MIHGRLSAIFTAHSIAIQPTTPATNTAIPLVTYTITPSERKTSTQRTLPLVKCTVDVECWDRTKDGVLDTLSTIRTALSDYRDSNIRRIKHTTSADVKTEQGHYGVDTYIYFGLAD